MLTFSSCFYTGASVYHLRVYVYQARSLMALDKDSFSGKRTFCSTCFPLFHTVSHKCSALKLNISLNISVKIAFHFCDIQFFLLLAFYSFICFLFFCLFTPNRPIRSRVLLTHEQNHRDGESLPEPDMGSDPDLRQRGDLRRSAGHGTEPTPCGAGDL